MLRRRGFTLIELLVVIAIIGILSTLVVTQLNSARIRARNSQAKNDISEMGKSADLFKNDDTAGELPIAALTVATAAYNPGNVATNNCVSSAAAGASGAAAGNANCMNNAFVGDNSTQDQTFQAIFAGRQTVATSGTVTAGSGATVGVSPSSYGLRVTKVPATGYKYFYMTADTALSTVGGNRSATSDYAIVADLTATGALQDSSARFYVMRNGNMAAVDRAASNVTGVGTAATAYVPSFRTVDNY